MLLDADRCRVSELKQLLENDGDFEKFFETVKVVVKARKMHSELENQNVEMARGNLALAAEAEVLKKQLSDVLAELEQETSELSVFMRENKSTLERYSHTTILRRFQQKIQEVGDESDNLLYQFCRGESEVNGFMQEYKALRTVFHKRSLELEKMKQTRK